MMFVVLLVVLVVVVVVMYKSAVRFGRAGGKGERSPGEKCVDFVISSDPFSQAEQSRVKQRKPAAGM